LNDICKRSHFKNVVFVDIIVKSKYLLICGHPGVFARGKTLLRPLLLMATYRMPLQRGENTFNKDVGEHLCVLPFKLRF